MNAEIGTVSSRISRPGDAWAMAVLAHGAGTGMRHPFLERLAEALDHEGLAVYRFQFPYVERGSRRPDRQPVLAATVRAAVATAADEARGLPLVAGGKSMGGRMTSLTAAETPGCGIRGIFFLGFPLHAPRKPDVRRADHLRSIEVPMLFIQGTRDPMAPLSTLSPIVRDLGPRATLHIVDGADHSFAVRKRDRADETTAIETELARVIAGWVATLCPERKPGRSLARTRRRPTDEISVQDLESREP